MKNKKEANYVSVLDLPILPCDSEQAKLQGQHNCAMGVGIDPICMGLEVGARFLVHKFQIHLPSIGEVEVLDL